MSDGLWGLIGVAVGGVLTFLFTQFSSWQDGKGQRHRIRNRVLYYLLEIHYQLGKMLVDSTALSTYYENYLKEKLGSPITELGLPPNLIPSLMESLKATIKVQILQNLQKIRKRYPNALADLSEIDPISAYRLHGLEGILEESEEFVDTITENVLEGLGDDPNAIKAKMLMQDSITSDVVDSTLGQIEDVIQELTKGISNIKIRKESRYRFALNRKRDFEKIKEECTQVLDTYFSNLEEQLISMNKN